MYHHPRSQHRKGRLFAACGCVCNAILPYIPSSEGLGATFPKRSKMCIRDRGKAFLPRILHKGGDVLVLIGPEGDFSPEEIDLAVRGGFREITLGSQRLRTETAAVMATALVAAANEPEIGTDDRQPSSKPAQ